MGKGMSLHGVISGVFFTVFLVLVLYCLPSNILLFLGNHLFNIGAGSALCGYSKLSLSLS